MTSDFIRTQLNVERRIVPVIVRSPALRAGKNPSNHPPVELFFPYYPVQRGCIACFDPNEGMAEASLDYYRETIRPYAYTEAAERLLALYRQRYPDEQLEARIKLPHGWMRVAWGR